MPMTGSERSLYNPTYLERELVRQPIRPLGPVSDFVVNDLPLALEIVRANPVHAESLRATVDALVEQIPYETIAALEDDPRAADIALLDLLYLRGAVANARGKDFEQMEPGRRLLGLTDALAQELGRTPSITYEDLIYTNPFEDPRLFTRGHSGSDELDFYETHRNIERRLERINVASAAAIEILSTEGQQGISNAVQLLSEAAIKQDETEILALTHDVGAKMEEPHFKLFSSYFRPYPKGEYTGAGGSKSDGWSQFQVLLAGDALPDDMRYHLEDYQGYFPREGQMDIQRAQTTVQTRGSLLANTLRLGNPPELVAAVVALDDFMTDWMTEHLRAVSRQHNEALQSSIERRRDDRETRDVLNTHRVQGLVRRPLGLPEKE